MAVVEEPFYLQIEAYVTRNHLLFLMALNLISFAIRPLSPGRGLFALPPTTTAEAHLGLHGICTIASQRAA